MAEIKHIFIVCGEASGDLHAANLAKEILKLSPDIKISAVGGGLLASTGVEIFCDIKDISVIGFFDVLKKLPKFFRLKKLILEKIKSEKPDAIILVDFSGFNLRLAKDINPSAPLRINGERSRTIDKSIPVIYYVSPQVWASREGRIKAIKKYAHKILVFFKFEEELYKKYGVDAECVGHPLLDIVKPAMEKRQFFGKFGLNPSKKTIALLPGSRRAEIENILPVMLEASRLIHKNIKHTQFVIAKSPQVDWGIYNSIIRGADIELEIVEGKTYDCLEAADFCLVASGTATLETAISGKPFLIIYKMGLLNYLLYRPQVKLPYIGMVNIVAGKKIIPEFIQFKATPKNIADEALQILKNPSMMEEMKSALAQVKSSLGEKGAASRAARIILKTVSS